MTDKKSGKGKWIAIGCLIPLVVVILGAVAVVGFGWFFLKDKLVMEPGQVEAGARKVMEYKFPKGSQGIIKMGMLGVDIYVVQSKAMPPEASLILATVPPHMAQNAEDEIRRSVNERFSRGFEIDSATTQKRTLCGQTAVVQIHRGKGRSPEGQTQAMTQYQTMVRHKESLRMAIVMGMGSRSERSAEAVFSSLRCAD